MLLSEYKSKELLAQYGIAVPPGKLARTAREAEDNCTAIPARKFVVKAQIAAGGRGLAGGIKFAATPSSVHEEAEKLLGTRLVTEQTGREGEVVNTVYVEAAEAFKAISRFEPVWIEGVMQVGEQSKELYLVDGSADIHIGYSMSSAKIEKFTKAPKAEVRPGPHDPTREDV